MTEQTMQEAMAHLEFRHPGLHVEWAGGLCPFQAEGTLHGLPFYFRFRHSTGTLRVGGDLHFKALYAAGMEFGEDEDQSWLSGDPFVDLLSQLIGKLERAEIYWEFEGVEPADVGQVKAGAPARYGAWGHTPAEAWVAMHQPSDWLLAKGVDAATQRAWVAARQMRLPTITVDDRVFPDPDPFATEDPR